MKKLVLLFAAFAAINMASAQCTDLFFSEYVEGSGFNKALEIFNPSPVSVNLGGYTVKLFSNGGTTPGNTLTLTGTIAPGDVYVIAYASAGDSIQVQADITSGVTNFNGDDAVVLMNGTDTIDIIGRVGEDPGTEWAVDTGTTKDYTLTRKADVHEGETDWAVGATQWNVLPKDTLRLGFHTIDPCGAVEDTMVRFPSTAATVWEDAGLYMITVALNASSDTSTFTVDVELVSGDTADIGGFTPLTLTFLPGELSQTFTVTLTDDTMIEPAETFVFRLLNPTNDSLTIDEDSLFTLTITASDVPVLSTTISQLTALDTTGQPLANGQLVQVSGTVYGVNMRTSGLQFTIHDATDGIQVFSPIDNFGYTVNEGDSVSVQGLVGFNSGMTQLQYLDTILLLGSGTLANTWVPQDLDESTESELVRLNNVSLVDEQQWSAGGSGFTVDITDGQTIWALRIDADVEVFNAAAPSGNFDVIGIGGQFDQSPPYTAGYQLLPRYNADIIQVNNIGETETAALSIFPNPTNGTFLLAGYDGTSQVVVQDAAGRFVRTDVTRSGNYITVKLSDVAQGLYFVTLTNGQSTLRGKVVLR